MVMSTFRTDDWNFSVKPDCRQISWSNLSFVLLRRYLMHKNSLHFSTLMLFDFTLSTESPSYTNVTRCTLNESISAKKLNYSTRLLVGKNGNKSLSI